MDAVHIHPNGSYIFGRCDTRCRTFYINLLTHAANESLKECNGGFFNKSFRSQK